MKVLRRILFFLFVSGQRDELEKTRGDGWLKQVDLKRHRSKRRILFRSFVLMYLAFLIVSQAATPTTASFTKTVTTKGKIVADEIVVLEEESEQEDKNREEIDTGQSEAADQEDELSDGADLEMDDEEESLNEEKDVESDAGTNNTNQTDKEDDGDNPDDKENTDEDEF